MGNRFDSINRALTSNANTTNTTFSANVAVAGTLAMASSFKRNRIINGNMLIDQRNSGAAVTPTSDPTYTLDRWALTLSQASKFTIQQNAGAVTPPAGFTKYLGATVAAAVTVGASDYFALYQPIEGYNVADLNYGLASAQTTTLSFWVRSSLTGTFGGVVKNSAGTRSYPFTYSVGSANTWTSISVTIPGDTSGTWLTDNGAGIVVRFGLGAGATFSGTAGAWASANYMNATGAVSVVGTSGATFYITGVQLEVGTIATPYEMQIYSDQLAQCQRYYEINSYMMVTMANGGYGNSYCNPHSYRVTKRAPPTLTAYSSSNQTGTSGAASLSSGAVNTVVAVTVFDSNTASGSFYAVGSSVYTLAQYSYTASAEL